MSVPVNQFSLPFQQGNIAVTLNETGLPNHLPTLIFVHGNSMSQKIWAHQMGHSQFPVSQMVSFDLPGHGDSTNLGSYSFKLLTEALTHVIQHFNPSNYWLVGHSLGGDLILQIIHTLSHCKGVILVGSAPVKNPPNIGEAYLPNPLVGQFFTKAIELAQLAALAGEVFYLGKGSSAPSFFNSDFIRTDGASREGIANSIGALDFIDEIQQLNRTSIPIHLVAGAFEKLVNITYLKELSEKLTLVPGAAHCPQWENPPFFNTTLLQLLQ